MKKILSLSLVLVMLVALVACGGGTTPESKAPESQAPESNAPESQAPEVVAPEWVKNVEVQIPASAGGGTDVCARAFINYINQSSDANLTAVNNTDGGGVVAYETVRNAKVDGSTLLYFHTTMCIKSATGIYDYKPADDFTVIAYGEPVEKGGYILVVPADGDIKTLEDFIADAKSRPGEILFGVETGGSSHIMAGLMSQAADIEIKYVEAGPDTEKMTALVGGSINACLVNPNQAKQYVEAGKVIALASVSTDAEGSRGSVLPDVASFIEQGVEFTYATNQFVLGPKDMDPALAEYIHDIIAAGAEDAMVNDIIGPAGMEMRFVPFADGQQALADTQARLDSVVEALGLKQ